MNIRHATAADVNTLAFREAACFPPAEAADAQAIAARVAAYPAHFWLLEDGGTVVGFVNGMATNMPDLQDEMYDNTGLHTEAGRWQMIFGVNTLPAYRGQGCAARLLRRAIADAEAQGRTGLVLTCKEKLIHYYAKFGFADEGVSASAHGGAAWHQMRLAFSVRQTSSKQGLK